MSAEIRELSNAEYHADLTALSSSQVAVFIESPPKFFQQFVERSAPREAPNHSMQLGTATHTLALEPERWSAEVAVIPAWALSSGSRRGKLWESFAAQNSSKILLTVGEAKQVEQMVAALREKAGDWLAAPGPVEQSLFWTDSETGLPLKSRIDKLLTTEGGQPFVLDLKTASDSTADGFSRSYRKFHYGTQEAHYSESIRVHCGQRPLFRFLVVRNREPISAAVYRSDIREFRRAFSRWREALRQLARCYQTGQWESPTETGVSDERRETDEW